MNPVGLPSTHAHTRTHTHIHTHTHTHIRTTCVCICLCVCVCVCVCVRHQLQHRQINHVCMLVVSKSFSSLLWTVQQRNPRFCFLFLDSVTVNTVVHTESEACQKQCLAPLFDTLRQLTARYHYFLIFIFLFLAATSIDIARCSVPQHA